MKKNVKILGAAAAALLAVAPVAASATPTFAADNQGGNSQIADNQGGNSQIIDPDKNGNKDNNEAQAVKKVNITANAVVKPGTINSFTPLASANQFSATNADNGSALSGFQVISITDTSNIYKGNIDASTLSSATAVKYGQKLEAGEEYTQVLSATVLTPAKAGTQYTFNGSTTEPSSETKYVTNVPVLVHIKVQDSTLTGNPYVANSNNDSFNDKQVGAEYKGEAITKVGEMVSYINGLGWKTYTSSTDANPQSVNNVTEADVTKQLTAAKIKVDDEGNFTLPTNGFYYTVTATNPKNGHSATARIFFPGDNNQHAYPVIWYYANGKNNTPTPIQEGSTSINKMPLIEVTQGDTDWKAYDNFASTQSHDNNATMPLSSQQVTNNNVNVNVPGMYNVTLNVTNSDGKTTQLTYTVVVRSGDKNAKSNVKVNYVKGYGVNLYHLYGSEPSYIGQRVAADSTITAYINDTKTVNGVSYTRVDGYGDNVWIQTQYLDGSWKHSNSNTNTNKPSTSSEEKVSGVATVTYKGRGGVNLLNAEGKYQNQYVKKGSAWKVFAKKTINGETMYRLGTQSQWIPAKYVSVK